MSDRLKNRFERVLQLLEILAEEAAKGAMIIVEGQNDIEALKELTVEGNMIPVKTAGKSFLDVVTEIEEQNNTKVILLLDFDRRGREWAKRLRERLEEKRIKVDISFWNRLRVLVGHEIKDVEGLPSYLKTLKRRIGN